MIYHTVSLPPFFLTTFIISFFFLCIFLLSPLCLHFLPLLPVSPPPPWLAMSLQRKFFPPLPDLLPFQPSAALPQAWLAPWMPSLWRQAPPRATADYNPPRCRSPAPLSLLSPSVSPGQVKSPLMSPLTCLHETIAPSDSPFIALKKSWRRKNSADPKVTKGGVLLAWLALVKQTGAVHRHRSLLINREMKHDDTVCSTDLYKQLHP